MRLFIGTILLLLSTAVSAQTLRGSWIMAYVQAKQPIYTMVEINGQYQMAEDVPQDSSFVYSNGLMLIDFRKDETLSYSWEGQEKWTYKIEQDQIYLFSAKDTLSGQFNEEQFAVSSSLDDRPTVYYFKPLGFSPDHVNLLNTSWVVKTNNSLLNKKEFYFEKQKVRQKVVTERANEVYSYYRLENLNAVEYEISYPLLESTYSEFGMIYLFKNGKKKLRGVYYPVIDDNEPQRKEIELRIVKR